MHTWKCSGCQQEMNLGMRQQHNMHVECFEEWYEKPLSLYKIEHEGSSYLEESLSGVQELITQINPNDRYTIEKVTVKQGVYSFLPEFKGF